MTTRRTSVEVPESARRLALEGPSWRLLVAGLRRPGHFFRELLRRVQEDRTLSNAAAMSYYFFFALFPMLLFVLALVSLMPLRGLDEWLVSVTVAYLPEEARTCSSAPSGASSPGRGTVSSPSACCSPCGAPRPRSRASSTA